MKVAVIGLGIMGLAMARRLVGAGHEVRGFDLRDTARQFLKSAGGVDAASPAEAVRGAETVLLMVVNAAQAEAAFFESGAAEVFPAGGVVIASYTQSALDAQTMAERLRATGHLLLDAPVSGGLPGAESGSLAIMASGPEEAFRKAEPVLSVVGGSIFNMGVEPGNGSTMKAVNQLLCAGHIAIVAEAFNFAARAGLDLKQVYDVLMAGNAISHMLKTRGPLMSQDDVPSIGSLDIFVKDLGIVLDAGRELRAPVPIASAAQQMFVGASAMGYGNSHDCNVIKAYQVLGSTRSVAPD